MEKFKSKIDIPVLILFFNRPEMLKEVWLTEEDVKFLKTVSDGK